MDFLILFAKIIGWAVLFVISLSSVAASTEDVWEDVFKEFNVPEEYAWLGHVWTFLVVCLWITIIVYKLGNILAAL